MNTGIERQTDTERGYRQKVTCMNTDVDVLTEHLLQREREGWEARMKLNAGIDRHMDRQGIETEGEVHEHRHRLTAPLLQREREGGKEGER